jgi:hypothetical protein
MTTDRAVRALEDIVAVEHVAPGMVRVVSWSDAYTVDARGEGCECPDKEYNLDSGDFCKHHYAAILATAGNLPTPFEVSDDLSQRVATDGGTLVAPAGKWTLYDAERDAINHYDSRSEAEDKQAHARNELGMDPNLYPPGELPEGFEAADEPEPEPTESEADPDPDPSPGVDVDPVDAEVIDHSPDAGNDHTPEYDDLPERSVGEDPLEWVPSDFIDHIDGTPAINRKGYEVLSHFYNVDVKEPEVMVSPEETDFTYCQVRATAVDGDGRECSALGSAHVDRGDESFLLLEMADTRARKRSLAIATGVGAVAVEELRNEVGE